MKCKNCGYVDKPVDKSYPENFSIFWKIYPRKVSKWLAQKVWAKLKVDDILLEKILLAIHKQKESESWKQDNGIFIPHPSTWLRQRRWDDELLKNAKKVSQFDEAAMEEAKRRNQELMDKEWERRNAAKGEQK